VTDDQHGEDPRPEAPRGSWERLPQGDYDDGATTFVQLPEGGIDALLASHTPLAAPGHGYVPPSITPTPQQGDPADGAAPNAPGAPGGWGAPAEGTGWPDAAPGTDPGYPRHPRPAHQDPYGNPHHDPHHDPRRDPPHDPRQDPRQGPAGGDTSGHGFAYHPQSTGQWTFEEPAHPGAAQGDAGPGHDVTGEWSIPVAGGDLPDESGEFTTSSLVEQWGGTPPPTLPGGAAAPWAPPGSEERPAEAPGGPFDGPYAPEGPASTPDAPQAVQGPSTPTGPVHPGPHDPYAGNRPGTDPYAAHGDPARPEPYAAGPDPAAGADAGRAPVEEHAPDAEPPVATPEDAPEGDEAPEEADRPQEADQPQKADRPQERPSAEASAPHPQDAPAPRDADAPQEADAPDGTQEDPAPVGEAPAPLPDEHPLVSYVLRVNGTDRPVTDAWIGESLLYVLRERLGLAGAKDGCSEGECGACNVQVDGRLVASCLVPSVTAAGTEVRTVEGLAVDGQPSDVQRALARCGAVQCGFCVPGMAMTVHDLLEGNPDPTDLETRQALCGNLCRCSGYRGVLDAVREVVAEREALGAAEDEADDGPGDEAGPGEPLIPHQAGPGAGSVHHDQSYGQDGGQR
jgi:aerobic-type carbon monoxide dehydrogenase small subunit (CoxS/CutS family)